MPNRVIHVYSHSFQIHSIFNLVTFNVDCIHELLAWLRDRSYDRGLWMHNHMIYW